MAVAALTSAADPKDKTDVEDTFRRVRRFFGQAGPAPRRFAKYPLENKGFHALIIVAAFSVIGTGIFMLFRVRTIFLERNPYLLSDKTSTIARLDDLPAGGGAATLLDAWRLGDLSGKPEGLAFTPQGRAIIGLDTRKPRRNLVLLEPAIAQRGRSQLS